MSCLLERKAQIIFVSASTVEDRGKRRRIIIESRPEFAIIRLNGSKKGFPIAWEAIYDLAERSHAKNMRIESRAEQRFNALARRSAG